MQPRKESGISSRQTAAKLRREVHEYLLLFFFSLTRFAQSGLDTYLLRRCESHQTLLPSKSFLGFRPLLPPFVDMSCLHVPPPSSTSMACTEKGDETKSLVVRVYKEQTRGAGKSALSQRGFLLPAVSIYILPHLTRGIPPPNKNSPFLL